MIVSALHRLASSTGGAYCPGVAFPNDHPDSMGQIDKPLPNIAAVPQQLRHCVFQYVPASNMQREYVDATTASQYVQEDMSSTPAFQRTTNANDLSVATWATKRFLQTDNSSTIAKTRPKHTSLPPSSAVYSTSSAALDPDKHKNVSLRNIFNRLFAVTKNREYRKDDPANPISPENVLDSLSFVRFQLFVILKLGSNNGKLTYTKALKAHRKFIDDLKRKLESHHKILKKSAS